MPCNSDYLSPTIREEETRKIIDLYLWIESHFKSKPDQKAEKYESSNKIYFTRKESDYFTNLLCKRCTELAKQKQLEKLLNQPNKSSRALANWWEDHQEADVIRKSVEDRKKKDSEKRKRILSKLTNEERKFLNL